MRWPFSLHQGRCNLRARNASITQKEEPQTMKKRLITTLTAFYAVFCFSSVGHAGDASLEAPPNALTGTTDAGVADATTEPVAAPMDTEGVSEEPLLSETVHVSPDLGVFKDLYDAGKGGDWRVFVVTLLMLLVSFTRWLASKWGRLDRLLNGEDDWAGAILVFSLSLLGAFASAWQVDVPLSLELFQAAWENALLAFGGYSVLWKKLVKPKLGFLN